MTSAIYANPDFSKKVRYNSKVEEGGTAWVENEVDIYDNLDSIEEEQTDFQPQEGEPHSEKKLPAGRNSSFRVFTVSLGVLYLLILAGIITRYIFDTSEKYNLQNRVNNLSIINNQSKNLIQQLQDQIAGTMCPEGWMRFGCSCYFTSTEKKSWYQSRSFCQNRASDLVIINSKEEQKIVSELSKNAESWIGLWTEQQHSGGTYQWKWVDGSTLTQEFDSFWATGEKHPTTYLYAAYCDQQGRWRSDYYYNHVKNWICEK
ncbi:CD209 antigen-like protein E isoform X2 [Channa argus]|uniref:CD209 antigen-like protein E isoform X2 n=1 Tax=Channa argus TaxID=215402 RepID=UPI003521EE9C